MIDFWHIPAADPPSSASRMARRGSEPFAAMSADPAVMEMLLPFPNRAASDAWIARMPAHYDEHGFCQWAVKIPGEASLIGAVGLNWVPHQTAFTPAVEMGWRQSALRGSHGAARHEPRPERGF
jgi:RimJ/RimL family protein N-acetyltransferase